VVDSASATGTYGIVLKQFASVGWPSWRVVQQRLAGSGRRPHEDTFKFYCCCTDRGSDQAKLRRFIAHEVAPMYNTFFIDWNCTLHQAALMYKNSLRAIDSFLVSVGVKFTYFSSMAKLINVWRENSWAVYKAWCQHSYHSANLFARRQPPRCLAGRWGSIYATEELLVKVGEVLPTILSSILIKRIDADIDERDNEEADDLRVEAQKEYRKRLGRWSRDTIDVMECLWFWCCVRIAHTVHGLLHEVLLVANKYNFSRVGQNKEVRFGKRAHTTLALDLAPHPHCPHLADHERKRTNVSIVFPSLRFEVRESRAEVGWGMGSCYYCHPCACCSHRSLRSVAA
jgi:hypothetical protein